MESPFLGFEPEAGATASNPFLGVTVGSLFTGAGKISIRLSLEDWKDPVSAKGVTNSF